MNNKITNYLIIKSSKNKKATSLKIKTENNSNKENTLPKKRGIKRNFAQIRRDLRTKYDKKGEIILKKNILEPPKKKHKRNDYNIHFKGSIITTIEGSIKGDPFGECNRLALRQIINKYFKENYPNY